VPLKLKLWAEMQNPNGHYQQRVLLNPHFVVASADASAASTSSVHVNPKFGGQRVHVNPNVRQTGHTAKTSLASSTSSVAVKTKTSVVVNPNFSGRPLPPTPNMSKSSSESTPPVPHINPKFVATKTATTSWISMGNKRGTTSSSTSSSSSSPALRIDAAKKDGYHAAVAAKSNKVFVNPNFASGGGQSQEQKTKKTIYVDPALVQMKKRQQQQTQKITGANKGSPGSEKENEPVAVITGSVFKKIGTKKLVRIKAKQSPSASLAKAKRSSPTYRTPPRGRKSFVHRLVTPLSLKRRHGPPSSSPASRGKHRSHRGRSLYRMLNPFKIDRRKASSSVQSMSMTRTPPQQTPSACAVVKTPKSCPPPKPLRTSLLATPAGNRSEALTVNIQGVKYKMSANGKTLNRIDPKAPPPTFITPVATTNVQRNIPARASIIARKVFLEGTYVLCPLNGCLASA
jgi:hypothetical protein